MGPETRTALWVLMTATGMVLLIGCANLANLALARGVSREREVAVRHLLARDGGAWSANWINSGRRLCCELVAATEGVIQPPLTEFAAPVRLEGDIIR